MIVSVLNHHVSCLFVYLHLGLPSVVRGLSIQILYKFC